MEEAPRYKHDCTKCAFLGQFEKDDLYFCPQGGLPTLIARYGAGPNYRSMPLAVARLVLRSPERVEIKGDRQLIRDYFKVSREAFNRAKKKGLIAE